MLLNRKRKHELLLPVCTGLFLLGIAAGIWYARMTKGEGYWGYFLQSYMDDHLQGAFAPVFSISFLSVMVCHGLLLFFAFSCFALPFILSLPFLRGFSFGMICALLTTQWASRGILMIACLLWLPAVIQAAALLGLSWAAADSSLLLCRGAVIRRGAYLGVSISYTVERFVFCSTAGLFAAFLEGLLSMLLGRYFL